ncbi:TniQ family protein [Cohnella sp. LGH]|uniref:TniQ family protein n=1 Tax=Cohnella sp. LGH TaxID=1619153 RepID=UPI001ADA658F|nr:TniQ family protein [Cohnella sp. LGH]QTH41663.1 TniQ family protein [Cohnella sp. LGH]
MTAGIYTVENQLLTVRPTPKLGESLTSFLNRAAKLNGCNEMDIWRSIHAGSIHMLRSQLFYRLDYDFCLIDPKQLSMLLDVTLDSIKKLTFFTVCSKFFDDPYKDYDRAMVMIQMALDKRSRKFCPICIEHEDVYKLTWLLKEVDYCFTHNIRLESNTNLADISEVTSDTNDLNKQEVIYRRWNFLLKSDKVLTKRYGRLNMERSLALKLLFVAQNQASVYVRKDIVGFSKNLVKSLVSFVRGTSSVKKVTQSLLFEVLNYANMTIEEFSNLEVPKSYLTSIFTIKEKKNNPPSTCLAPWCYNQEHQRMILIDDRVEPRKKGIRYPYYYVCKGCFMRYAYHPEINQWQEIDGKIELVSAIKKLVEAGMTRSEVSRELKINYFQISEIFGYLAYHHLLPKSIHATYAYSNIPENLVSLFEAIQCELYTYPETKYKKTRNRYGWNLKMYSYFYAHSDVQLYFIHKPSELKKPLKKHNDLCIQAERSINDMVLSDIRLSLNQVASSLDCSESTLHSYGIASVVQEAKSKQSSKRLHDEEKELRKTFDTLISRHDCKEVLSMRAVYNCLGRNRDYVVENYPGFINYMTASVKEVNNKAEVHRLKQLVRRIKEAIQQLSEKQRDISVTAVAKCLGIKYIHVKGYRPVKEKIKQEIEDYKNILVGQSHWVNVSEPRS